MYHLGISYGHNATVAVMANGELIFCQSEERLNRIKNSTGFPDQTLAYVYRNICDPAQVASCSLFLKGNAGYLILKQGGFLSLPMAPKLDAQAIKQWAADPATALAETEAYTRYIAGIASDPATNLEARRWFSERLSLPADKIQHIDHHLGHALSTLPFVDGCGTQDTLIFTLDGEGDGICASVTALRDGALSVLSTAPEYLSVGKIYEGITGILGFRMLEHEYKVMGMAPYAKSDYYRDLTGRFQSLLRINEAGLWEGSFRGHRELLVRLVELCQFQRFDAVAGALQSYTESVVCDWIRYWVEATGIRSIACAGGVFMNVKANQRVLGLDCVDRLAVVPSCGDESTAIGCTVFGSRHIEPTVAIKPVRHLYLGSCHSDREIEQLLIDGGLSAHFEISEPPDINAEIARLLAEGAVVARCSGAMEFGARALGNRSILSHPAKPENVALINDAIKNRDFWMPFAPSILDDAVEDLMDNPKKMASPFMMVSFDATAQGRRDLLAALHRADFTLRPQMLKRDANPDYYALISEFRRRTGIGAVLNTSFNLHGEPIVGSPLDAIRTMASSGLRHLALNKFLLSKPET